jgi:hypothetical protein
MGARSEEHHHAVTRSDGGGNDLPPRRSRPRLDRRLSLVPDTALDAASIVGPDEVTVLDVRAASLRGEGHRAAATVRQDAYSFRLSRDRRWLVVAVAGGAPAGPWSHVAAGVATSRGCELALTRLADDSQPAELPWPVLLGGLAEDLCTSGRRFLADIGGPDAPTDRDVARLMATALLLAVVATSPDGDGRLPVHLMVLGGCSAWARRQDGDLEPLFPVHHAGEPFRVTSGRSPGALLPLVPGGGPAVAGTTIHPGDTVVLATGGMHDPLGAGKNRFDSTMSREWHLPPAPITFATHVDSARPASGADRTAVAVWHRRRAYRPGSPAPAGPRPA